MESGTKLEPRYGRERSVHDGGLEHDGRHCGAVCVCLV